jgi:hypothetical protein
VLWKLFPGRISLQLTVPLPLAVLRVPFLSPFYPQDTGVGDTHGLVPAVVILALLRVTSTSLCKL